MHLTMKRHATRFDSRFAQFHMPVPLAVREQVRGRVITVLLPPHGSEPGATFEAKLGQFVRGSLYTRDPEAADTRHLLIQAHLSKLYVGVKGGPVVLSHEQRVALSGDVYDLLVDQNRANPGAMRDWEVWNVTTGPRVGELTQLWGDRVRVEGGVRVIRIEPASDGGSLKNEGSERTAPLHPVLIESCFLVFARTRTGPLFYGRSSEKTKDGMRARERLTASLSRNAGHTRPCGHNSSSRRAEAAFSQWK